MRVGEEAAAAEAEEDAVDAQQDVARGGVRDGEVVAGHADGLGHRQRRLVPRAEARVHHRQRRHRLVHHGATRAHVVRGAGVGCNGDGLVGSAVGMGARVFPCLVSAYINCSWIVDSSSGLNGSS